MKLLEALKNVSIENLDTEEMLIECAWNEGEDNSQYDMFIHNLKALCSYDEEAWEKLSNFEMTPDFLNKLKEDDYEDLFDDSINDTILNAAWLTHNGYDYAECEENDDFDDLYDDSHNYKFSFGDFNLEYEYETDIDLT